MRYANLGASGLVVSRVGLGMMSFGNPQWQPWVLPAQEASGFVRLALEAGINFFDTADFYSLGQSEQALGDALRAAGCRDQVVIASKVGLPMSDRPNDRGLSRKHVLAGLDASLKRLQTDYIDLYQLHRFDPSTPLDETLDALDIAVRSGRVRYVGASNFSTAQLAPAALAHRWRSAPSLASMQIQYNLAYREEERDMIPFCRQQGMGLIVYSPLARGLLGLASDHPAQLSDREQARVRSDLKAQQLYGTPEDRAIAAAVRAIAARRETGPARIAMAWLHSRPGIDTVLCGALDPAHLNDAIQALELQLSSDELDELDAAYVCRPVKDDALSAVQASGRFPSPDTRSTPNEQSLSD